MDDRNFDLNLFTERDREVFAYIMGIIKGFEPCTVLGLRDLGKDRIYENLARTLKSDKKILPNYQRVFFDITTIDEIDNLLPQLESIKKPILLILNFAIEKDVSDYIEKIGHIRTKRDSDFIYVLFANCRHFRALLVQKEKVIYRNLYVLKPLNKEDSGKLLDSFESRFNYKLTKKERNQICELAQGQVGLMKSLFLLVSRRNRELTNLKQLICEPTIQHRLEGILKDAMPKFSLKDMYQNQLLFEQLGFIKDKDFFNPLLRAYFEYQTNLDDPIEFKFSTTEKQVFEYLQENTNQIIARDDIAKVIWKDDWQGKYSDWAIDQTIHRIRKNLKFTPYKITTKKGIGFILETQ